jgi:hypothetical protein
LKTLLCDLQNRAPLLCIQVEHAERRKFGAGKESAPRGKEKIQEMISKGSRSFKRAFQKEIDLHVLGKELVSPWV